MPRRILVVEDSPTQAGRARLLLEDQGYRVELASNGREGLEKAQSLIPDLIISDVLMPEMDGFALCQAIKSAPGTKRIPFVLLTGQRTPMDIIRGLERGADNFITKPFEDSYLLDRVQRIFENLAHREKGGPEMEVSVRFGGREVVVNADKQQMIELLFSTSEELSESNKQLEAARVQLEEQARSLERTVEERTRELGQAEEKYRTLVEQMPAVVYAATHELVGDAFYISPQIEALLGYTPAEWTAGPGLWAERTHPEDRENIDALFGRLRANHVPVSAEYRLFARDGRQVWVRDEARVVRVSEGSPLFVQGVLLDITDRKRFEEALQESETSFRLLFASNPHPMWVFDRQTLRFLEVNDAALAHYGYSHEEFLAMRLTDIHPSEDMGVLTESLHQPVEADSDRRLRPWRHRLKDGRVIQVEVATHAFEGRPDVLVVAHDVTERQFLQAQLLQSQKMEAIGQLAAGVAHDFNNLLGVITGYGELLLKDVAPGQAGRSRVEQILKAADRAAALTRQLLAFGRKQILQPEVLDLNAVLSDVENMLRRLIGEQIEVFTSFADDLGHVRADAGQMEQVILNLAVNARDAMPGGGKIIIETANVELDETYTRTHADARPGPHVMLGISDTGTGIDPSILGQIFEPFFTTTEEGKGTGLGLSTVYGIVKQSGGHIGVYTEPGRGTTFKVYLPRIDAMGGRPERVTQPTPSDWSGTETILIVEDEESLRQMMREVLTSSGYSVIEATGAEEALVSLGSHPGPVHLLLTDVIMPRMNGKQLAATIHERFPATRVLYISGYTSEAIGHHEILEAPAHFLQKPFTVEALLQGVRDALDTPRPGRS
jgi:two-component system cell cycle sensor histidine kinase/response regulator CckA